jgi:nicotinamide riboside transporter PnuC
MNKISIKKYSSKQWFALISAGVLGMVTIYSLFYPLLGNPTGDKILGIVALVWMQGISIGRQPMVISNNQLMVVIIRVVATVTFQ